MAKFGAWSLVNFHLSSSVGVPNSKHSIVRKRWQTDAMLHVAYFSVPLYIHCLQSFCFGGTLYSPHAWQRHAIYQLGKVQRLATFFLHSSEFLLLRKFFCFSGKNSFHALTCLITRHCNLSKLIPKFCYNLIRHDTQFCQLRKARPWATHLRNYLPRPIRLNMSVKHV